jgi:hypothetical protein
LGLCIYEEIANGTYKHVWYDAIENISYCVAEPLHRRIFAWIARSRNSNELECHVVLCRTTKRARLLAELLAKTFYESYRYRQQQQQIIGLSPNLSTRCSICDTIDRQQQQTNNRLLLNQNHSNHHQFNDHLEEKQGNDDYEHISYHEPIIARAFVHNYEENSMNSNSRPSIDYDTTLADEESIKPADYYRR